jgi:sterol desaturase/sphingolipid hydroxylase (fatty acid hydroxylase superfamily)
MPLSLKSFLRVALSLGTLVVLIWIENRHSLRRSTEPKIEHNARNLAVAAVSVVVIQGIESPLVQPLTPWVGEHKWGLVQFGSIPGTLRLVLAVLLMDYTLYIWHVLTHRIAFLWRFHSVHHVDRDLTASTALRFHFGELAISIPFRALQVLLLGVDPVAFVFWQTFLSLSILFHHSNIRFPFRVERLLNLLIVTPRMHGIHHSADAKIAWGNWSSGLTVWDRLHRTFKIDPPQEEITIGVAGFDRPDQISFLRLLTLPFRYPASARKYHETAVSATRI